jgi:hypothetical protein
LRLNHDPDFEAVQQDMKFDGMGEILARFRIRMGDFG